MDPTGCPPPRISSNEGMPVEMRAKPGAEGDGIEPIGGRFAALGVRRTNGILKCLIFDPVCRETGHEDVCKLEDDDSKKS